MAYETITTTQQEGVLTITLNRPDSLNALTAQLLGELSDALRSAERDAAVRALVLTGAGRAFCSGQDLKSLEQIEQPDGAYHFGDWLRRNYHPVVQRLRSMEKPIVAAVNGPAAGAGMSLALACDLRLVADNAFFQTVFLGIGLVPDSGQLYFLPRLVGPAKAAELILLNERIGAEEAVRIGLANRVVPADQLGPAALELAGRLARGPGRAIALVKRGLSRSLASDLAETLEYEAQLQEIAGRTEDFREGVAAFVEKRPPRFQGR